MKTNRRFPVLVIFMMNIFILPFFASAGELPNGFVNVKHVIPDIVLEMRYYTNDNFIGRPINGYVQPRCIMTREAAEALKHVQKDLKEFSLGLKIYDAYRPQRAVNHFVRWAKDLKEVKMKSTYYPSVAKKNLFKKGYIASRSSHTRGSTVDLTIVYFDGNGRPQELDMGTGFDFFSPKSWPDNPSIDPAQRAHRMLLQEIMKKHGFKPYAKEWWHFTLANEPYPDHYFDFPIE